MKRLVVGVSVSVLAMFAAAPAASAAPSSQASEVAHAKVAKVKKANHGDFKSQVSVKTPGGGVSTLRIDWD